MALESMGYTTKSVAGTVEILFNSDYTARALTLDTSAFTDGICKAGTPIAATGKKAATDDTSKTSNALGILLFDVTKDRPQGSVVYYGTINTAAAQKHSGVTYDDATKTALKNVVFM